MCSLPRIVRKPTNYDCECCVELATNVRRWNNNVLTQCSYQSCLFTMFEVYLCNCGFLSAVSVTIQRIKGCRCLTKFLWFSSRPSFDRRGSPSCDQMVCFVFHFCAHFMHLSDVFLEVLTWYKDASSYVLRTTIRKLHGVLVSFFPVVFWDSVFLSFRARFCYVGRLREEICCTLLRVPSLLLLPLWWGLGCISTPGYPFLCSYFNNQR